MSDFLEHSYLCHHGILGMKWGIRRYQNPDGSLTSAGKARYGSGNKVFISGSSKTQDKNSGYYRKNLPSNIKNAIDSKMKNGGAKATRNNVDRLIEQNKDVDVYKLTDYNLNIRMNADEFKKETESEANAKQNIAKLEKSLSRISDLKSYKNKEAMKDPKTRHEWRDAADLGLKVYEKDDGFEIDRNNKDDLNSWRSWFLYEDQTIGKPEIAAMVNRGYDKKEILDILDTAKNTGYYGDTRPENDFAAAVQFGAQEGYNLEYFVKRCLEEKQ